MGQRQYCKKEDAMTLIPWRQKEVWRDPFSELENIQNEINKLFDVSLTRDSGHNIGLLDGAWRPAVDMYDSKDTILVKADVPGLRKDDIEVMVQGDTLIIKGEKKQEKEVHEEDYARMERYYGSFQRAIRLPSEVQTEKVGASYENGVLKLTLPKSEQAKPKQIKVDIK